MQKSLEIKFNADGNFFLVDFSIRKQKLKKNVQIFLSSVYTFLSFCKKSKYLSLCYTQKIKKNKYGESYLVDNL
jgi:hypothetical protein